MSSRLVAANPDRGEDLFAPLGSRQPADGLGLDPLRHPATLLDSASLLPEAYNMLTREYTSSYVHPGVYIRRRGEWT
jgi:hypothetical protein